MFKVFSTVVLPTAVVACSQAQVYRADRKQYPRNGWSMYGLTLSLTAQGRQDEADAILAGYQGVWQRADVELISSVL